jgi:hypothetical protein
LRQRISAIGLTAVLDARDVEDLSRVREEDTMHAEAEAQLAGIFTGENLQVPLAVNRKLRPSKIRIAVARSSARMSARASSVQRILRAILAKREVVHCQPKLGEDFFVGNAFVVFEPFFGALQSLAIVGRKRLIVLRSLRNRARNGVEHRLEQAPHFRQLLRP